MQQASPVKPMQAGGAPLPSPFPLLGNGIGVGGLGPNNKAMARPPPNAKLMPQGLPQGAANHQRGVGGGGVAPHNNPNNMRGGGVVHSPAGVGARPGGAAGGGVRVDMGASKGSASTSQKQQQTQQQTQPQQPHQQQQQPQVAGRRGDVGGRAGQQQQQQQQMGSNKAGPIPYGNRVGVANGGGGGVGVSGGGSGAAGAAGPRPGPFPPGAARGGHMGPMPGPGFSPHGETKKLYLNRERTHCRGPTHVFTFLI